MSYNWHQKRVLDSALPLSHRYSHLRSCALSVASLLKRRRSAIISEVRERTGINIEGGGDEAQLLHALGCLNEIRATALESAGGVAAHNDA